MYKDPVEIKKILCRLACVRCHQFLPSSAIDNTLTMFLAHTLVNSRENKPIQVFTATKAKMPHCWRFGAWLLVTHCR